MSITSPQARSKKDRETGVWLSEPGPTAEGESLEAMKRGNGTDRSATISQYRKSLPADPAQYHAVAPGVGDPGGRKAKDRNP